jgi:hypothetical protein
LEGKLNASLRKVEFPSEGATLRAYLYIPDVPDGSDSPRPTVVMAHGTSATITMVIDRYAQAFCDAGFAVLLYEHRNFGISGGEPRQEINPWVQARGYVDAITYVATLKEVDSERIAIWGDSYSGGQAIVVAAVDERVKAVVVQCPVCGPVGPQDDTNGTQFRKFQETFQEGDVTGDVATRAGPMPVVSFDQVRLPSLLQPLSAFRWFIEHGGRHGSGWQNDVTRVIPTTPVPFSPLLCSPHVKVPTLMIVAPEDEMVQANPAVSLQAFELISGPKEGYEIAGGHFGLLWHPSDLFDEASRVQREFLLANLA